jgi:hypothetical protein
MFNQMNLAQFSKAIKPLVTKRIGERANRVEHMTMLNEHLFVMCAGMPRAVKRDDIEVAENAIAVLFNPTFIYLIHDPEYALLSMN